MNRKCAVFFLFASVAFCPVATWGQEEPPPGVEEMNNITRLLSEGKTLAALSLAEKTAESSDVMGQELATFRTFVGDCQGALAAMDKAGPALQEETAPKASLFEGYVPHPAAERIIELARDRRIVIINEAHHVPRHRAFTHQLLQGLKDAGYTCFAAEAFGHPTSRLEELGYPLQTTGYYISEPVFGDLVRQALKLGFTPIAYESTRFRVDGDMIDQINARESEQCQNLVDRIFARDPAAKVVIHVGYSHATEDVQTRPDGRELSWMAARLAKATGIDPLTIDQTGQSPRSTIEKSPRTWKMACEEFELASPVVFESAAGDFLVTGNWAGKVDIQVFHPPVNEKIGEGRPDWLLMNGYRRLVEIPVEIQAGDEGRLLVQAFVDGESDEAVPFDAVVLDPDLPRPKLALRTGRFRIVTQDESGDRIHDAITLDVPEISERSRDK